MTDVGIVGVPTDIAENIRTNEDIIWRQGFMSGFKKFSNRFSADIFIYRLGKGHAAIIGKADIIKLDFIKTKFSGNFGNGNIIIPHFALQRFCPAQSFPIAKYTAPLGSDG